MMILLIDDAREGFGYDIVARNSEAGLKVLMYLHYQSYGITELHIDFDLGTDSMNGNELIMYALKHSCIPDRVSIVSQNPVGRKQIAATLLDNGFKQITPSKFERIK
jgi:hypothetical protein